MTSLELPTGANTALPSSEILPPHYAFPLDINGRYFDVKYDPLDLRYDLRAYIARSRLSDPEKQAGVELSDNLEVLVNRSKTAALMSARFKYGDQNTPESWGLNIYPDEYSKMLSRHCRELGISHPDEVSRLTGVALHSDWVHERKHMIQFLNRNRFRTSIISDSLLSRNQIGIEYMRFLGNMVQSAPLINSPSLSMTTDELRVPAVLFGLALLIPPIKNIIDISKWYGYYGSTIEQEARNAQNAYLRTIQPMPIFEVVAQPLAMEDEGLRYNSIGTTLRGQVYTSGL